jgi:hypothetical protein
MNLKIFLTSALSIQFIIKKIIIVIKVDLFIYPFNHKIIIIVEIQFISKLNLLGWSRLLLPHLQLNLPFCFVPWILIFPVFIVNLRMVAQESDLTLIHIALHLNFTWLVIWFLHAHLIQVNFFWSFMNFWCAKICRNLSFEYLLNLMYFIRVLFIIWVFYYQSLRWWLLW